MQTEKEKKLNSTIVNNLESKEDMGDDDHKKQTI
jgi:hypothetical protein